MGHGSRAVARSSPTTSETICGTVLFGLGSELIGLATCIMAATPLPRTASSKAFGTPKSGNGDEFEVPAFGVGGEHFVGEEGGLADVPNCAAHSVATPDKLLHNVRG